MATFEPGLESRAETEIRTRHFLQRCRAKSKLSDDEIDEKTRLTPADLRQVETLRLEELTVGQLLLYLEALGHEVDYGWLVKVIEVALFVQTEG